MFTLGLLLGAAGAMAFVLYGNGELLIELAEKIRKVSARWREQDWTRPAS